jgi:hypothetical protein
MLTLGLIPVAARTTIVLRVARLAHRLPPLGLPSKSQGRKCLRRPELRAARSSRGWRPPPFGEGQSKKDCRHDEQPDYN